MTLERELIEIFASTPFERNRAILIGYYGWEDGREHTLTEIGGQFGITRERVRQICAKLTKRLKNVPIKAPVMDRVLALISDLMPCPAARIETELVRRELTDVNMSIEGVANSAKLLGRPVNFKVVSFPSFELEAAGEKKKEKAKTAPSTPPCDTRLVVLPDQVNAVLAAIDLARKDVYFHGLSTVDGIDRTISARFGNRVGAKLVRQAVMLMDGFRWLEEPSGWFSLLPLQRHGLPKAIDKALAVAGSVTGSQLRTAIARNHRLWKEPPPEKVLLAFCRQMEHVRVEGDRVRSDPPRDWKKSLTGVEAKLVQVLLDHGPVMERGAMEDICVDDGMNRFSFHAFVSWSPVIAQFGHSVYGLLGTKFTAKQVKELLAKRRASQTSHRVLDRHGMTDDGKVWLRYRLSKAASTYAVITVPAALKKVVRGRFQLIDLEGHEIGTLATKDGRAWGLGAFLRKQGANTGDYIILTLDLKERTAMVKWDDEKRVKNRFIAIDENRPQIPAVFAIKASTKQEIP